MPDATAPVSPTPVPLGKTLAQRQIDAYREQFGFCLERVDAGGRLIEGEPTKLDCGCGNCSHLRRLRAIEQSRYWGEAIINLCCDNGYAMWGVPIIDNNELLGGLLVTGVELEGQSHAFHKSVQDAANALFQLALEANLIPQAEVQLARQRAEKESDRFLAIEATKNQLVGDDIRTTYMLEEPAMLGAIKEGNIREARSILNKILAGVYGHAEGRIELLKSAILELVVMMNRAAVEAGAEPAAVLGRNYQSLSELSLIDDEEDLADWVRRMLETLIESIRSNHTYPQSLLMLKAVRYMQSNLHKHIRRDEVARVAGVSPSHFSKLATERLGRSFSSLLTQMRVTKAKELLAHSDKTLCEIAQECGFCDQSHFNKSFRAETSHSPSEYRKSLRLG